MKKIIGDYNRKSAYTIILIILVLAFFYTVTIFAVYQQYKLFEEYKNMSCEELENVGLYKETVRDVYELKECKL